MVDDNIHYGGPSKDISIPIGSNLPGEVPMLVTGVNELPTTTLPDLISRLNALRDYVAGVTQTIENSLVEFILPIASADTKLQSANSAAWPSNLGSPPNFISYNYYKTLSAVDTAASHYIRDQYSQAMRDVGGSSGLDFLAVLDFVSQEIDLVSNFLEQYIGNLDDPAEHRIMELFAEWVSSAEGHAQTVNNYISNPGGVLQDLPENEVAALQQDEAQQSQAVFKVKLNSLNGEIASAIDYLQRNFAQYADLFFNKFLGPALQFRLDVSRKITPKSTTIGNEVYKTTSALNTNVKVSISDQLRRVQMFEEKMTELENLIMMRDSYRNYIVQISAPANNTPTTGASGQVIRAPSAETAATVVGLQTAMGDALKAASNTNKFTSPHNALDGRLDPAAHPQYLLVDGSSVVPGTYGGTNKVPVITVDKSGIVTSASVVDGIFAGATPGFPVHYNDGTNTLDFEDNGGLGYDITVTDDATGNYGATTAWQTYAASNTASITHAVDTATQQVQLQLYANDGGSPDQYIQYAMSGHTAKFRYTAGVPSMSDVKGSLAVDFADGTLYMCQGGTIWHPVGGTTYVPGTGITISGNTIAVTATAVTPGTYGDATHIPQITVDSTGRIDTINLIGTSGGTTYTAGTGITISGSVISVANSGVTPGTYGDGTHVGRFTVDATGRISSASSVGITPAGLTKINLSVPITIVSGLAPSGSVSWYSFDIGVKRALIWRFTINSNNTANYTFFINSKAAGAGETMFSAAGMPANSYTISWPWVYENQASPQSTLMYIGIQNTDPTLSSTFTITDFRGEQLL